jgi:DNA-binding transcriptional LysR family regulator
MELDSLDMIKKYVALGMGISVGPKLAIEESDLSTLGIASLANFLPVNQAGIVTLPGKNLSSPAEKFLKVMRDTLHVSSGIS